MLAAPSTVAPAFAELREAVSNEIILEPLFVPSYVALLSAVEQDPELFAWASPLVALDLVRGQFAVPLVAVTVLTLLAGAFAYAMKIETRLAFNTNKDEEFYWMGRGGVERATTAGRREHALRRSRRTD